MFIRFSLGFALCLSAFTVALEQSYDLPKGSPKQVNIKNELSMLDNLVEVTQTTLDNQKKLRDLLKLYQVLQAKYLQNEQDKEVLFKLVRVAYLASESIKENQLSQIFDPEFLQELNLFAQVGAKRGIPKP